MDNGFFIAQKTEDGSPGRPVGNDDGAIMLFEDFSKALEVKNIMSIECGALSIFKVNLSFAGEVFAN